MVDRKSVMSKPVGGADPVNAITVIAFAWIIVGILAGFVGLRTGLQLYLTAEAIGLALAPGVVTLLLAPRLSEEWARTFLAFAWIGFASIGVAATGGFGSPLAAAFILAPAFIARTGDRARIAETAFFAALAYAVSGALSVDAEAMRLGPLPAIASGVSLLGAGALIAVPSQAPAARAVSDDGERARREAAEIVAAQRRRVGELAHELRTPLNHILGFSDVMRQRLFGPLHEKYAEYVELIHASGRNLLDLANGLLDLSRLEAGKYPLDLERFDVRPSAEEAVNLARLQAQEKSITLTLEADAALPVRADARALRQILTNLLANALKFTPEGGAVIVRAHQRRGDLVLEVQDNGAGFAAHDKQRLARPFERGAGHGEVDGYGLGLSLVHGFASLHGGALEIADAPGGGALVRVVLPVISP